MASAATTPQESGQSADLLGCCMSSKAEVRTQEQ